MDLAYEIGFERGGAFAYSQEEGTPAAEMEGQVDEEVKQVLAASRWNRSASVMGDCCALDPDHG